MEEKVESEHSYSGSSSSSSSGSSSDSSDEEENVFEPVCILGETLLLPQELCEYYGVFKEFFSMRTWNSLEDKHKEQLMQHLPKFSENDEEEKEKTIKMLFNHEPFHFNSPLSIFFNNLRQGNYRPDIAKMRKFLKKARAKQQRLKIKSYYAKLLPEVLISRERLLAAAKAAPPGPIPHLPPLTPRTKNNNRSIYIRAKQRYFEELGAIRGEVGGDESEDENYPDGPPDKFIRKRKQPGSGQSQDSNVSGTLGGSDSTRNTTMECLKNILAIHRTRRQYRENHPELHTTGITLDDIKQRVALVNGAKKPMFGSQKAETPIQKLKRGPKKETPTKGKTMENKTAKKGKEDLTDSENKNLTLNVKIKCENESDSESSSFVDPVASPRQSKKPFENVEIKQEVVDARYPEGKSVKFMDNKLESAIKQEPMDTSISNSSKTVHPVPIKLEDLDGIDMMALPIELADDSGEVQMEESPTQQVKDEVIVDPDESLTETTHANFLSLVRALFPAKAAHRASKQQLHARCAAVMRSPIAPLNTWYNMADNWCAELDSALDFLAGERGPHPDDFVPYLQYIPENQMYQWIGAGRDCDAILGRLCERWLRAVSPPPKVAESAPARYPTSWVVRSPTSAELVEFRNQEKRRFNASAKPFTYVQHGYKSVVGPCIRASVSCGGNTSLLVGDRPRPASFLALVRDAVARLPNGEGTRHDVATLMKMSQWIAPCTDQNLLTAVSSSLDKLLGDKRNPFVKYDQRTAFWTYIYRHRSEEDWYKSISGTTGRSRTKQTSPGSNISSQRPTQRESKTSSPVPHDLEVSNVEEVTENASDSDVDVDDSGPSSGPQLSSAQLLMQATQGQPKPQVPNKPKGKLVATPQTKKPQIKPTKPTTITQSKQPTAKQSPNPPKPSLMTQSVKQANILAQATKTAPIIKQTINAASLKQVNLIPVPKQNINKNIVKQISAVNKQVTSKSVAKTNVTPVKQSVSQVKSLVNQSVNQPGQLISQPNQSVNQPSQAASQSITSPIVSRTQVVTQVASSSPQIIATPHKSPQLKHRVLQAEGQSALVVSTPTPTVHTTQNIVSSVPAVQNTTLAAQPTQAKILQATRSLLIRPPSIQTTVSAAIAISAPITQLQTSTSTATARRGVVRVLSPATQAPGKSLISPQALLQQNISAAKKRLSATTSSVTSVTTVAQSTSGTTVVNSVATAVSSSPATRTVQLAGGRTLQLAANQTVHLPSGQAVQLSGHTLQLSSLQLPTHSVRLPSGNIVQLASPQTIQAVRAAAASAVKNPGPKTNSNSPSIKSNPQSVQIPVSTVQLAGQTVQIAGQNVQLTGQSVQIGGQSVQLGQNVQLAGQNVQIAGQNVQIAGQSVQLTGHTVKLPSGQSVQVASQSVLPQNVQLPSGQTVQLNAGNVQTVQLGGQNVQLSSSITSGQSVQLTPQTVQIGGQTVQLSGQTVQLSGQTVQLPTGQTVQLPSGQTLQLPSGQTVQLSSGQTLQLASGQTVQLANQTPKSLAQVIRPQNPTEKSAQPIVAKLLTNAQGQMISLEGVVGGARSLQLSGARGRGVRVLSRPLLLPAARPTHNYILHQADGSAIRMTSAGGAMTSQAIVLGNIGAQAVTSTTSSAPVLKLQQCQRLKCAIKRKHTLTNVGLLSTVTTPSATSSGAAVTRSVLMEGQQLKLVGGRHVLARILRPAQQPQRDFQ